MRKKVDIHVHFDGSLVVDWAYEKAKDELKITKEEFTKLMQVDENAHSLVDYLARFDTPLKLLQTKSNLKEAMISLILELDRQGLIYAEIRFAPQQHIKEGLSQKEVVEVLLEARKQALSKTKQLHVNYILCMMILKDESLTHDLNMETIELAYLYKNEGVVALDLAGAEGTAPMKDFEPLFLYAKQLGLSFTIHAGESFGPENISKAIEMGAKRIGHGTSAIFDSSVLSELKNKKIPLEVCVTSNIQSEAVSSYENHPITKYYNDGILVTINTDNMTISNTNLENEYVHLKQLGWDDEMIFNCQLNAIRCAFISNEDRDKYIGIIKKDRIIQKIQNLEKPVFIAIDGDSASGKTTFADELAQSFDVNVFHMDDYFLEKEKRTSEIAGNIDFKRLIDEVFVPIQNKQNIETSRFDCKKQELKPSSCYKYKTINIIEGSFSMHPKLFDFYDYTIFMTIPYENQLNRIKKRNPDSWQNFVNIWIPNEKRYFNEMNIKDRADVLI